MSIDATRTSMLQIGLWNPKRFGERRRQIGTAAIHTSHRGWM